MNRRRRPIGISLTLIASTFCSAHRKDTREDDATGSTSEFLSVSGFVKCECLWRWKVMSEMNNKKFVINPLIDFVIQRRAESDREGGHGWEGEKRKKLNSP